MHSESVIQKAVLDYLGTRPNVYYFRSGSGAVKTSTGNFFKSGKKGCPDIVCCINSIFTGLEIKTEKGRQSKVQKQAQKDIEAAGGEYHIVRCLADVKKIV